MTGVTLIADDYAMTPAVSRGILRLLEHGRISGTGAMTNRPAFRGWSHALRGFIGKADLGLHLNLTLAAPLTAMPLFAPSQSFPALGQVVRSAWTGGLPLRELEGEITAQLDAFEQAMGTQPDFIDGHQHVQGLPGVRTALINVLKRRYPLGKRPWVRVSGDSIGRIFRRGRHAQKALMVAGLTTGFASAVARAGFVSNDGFAGFSAFKEDISLVDEFARYLVAPGERHLVMCHPGEIDEELVGLDPVVATRPLEMAFLLSDEAEEQRAAAGLTLRRLLPMAS